MQIIINISHNLYESIIKDYDLSKLGEYELYKAVQKGRPLPEHHNNMEEEKNCDTCQFDGMCPSNVRLLVKHNGCTTWTPKQAAMKKEKSCLNCRYYPNTAPCDLCYGYSNYNEWQIEKEPTAKQIKYATYLAERMGIDLPKECTKEAYSNFISKWKPVVNEEDKAMNESNCWQMQYI